MARITVEDCLEKEQNRFELVLLASKRAKQLSSGSEALIDGNNKFAVMALREIAAGLVTKDNIDNLVPSKPFLLTREDSVQEEKVKITEEEIQEELNCFEVDSSKNGGSCSVED